MAYWNTKYGLKIQIQHCRSTWMGARRYSTRRNALCSWPHQFRWVSNNFECNYILIWQHYERTSCPAIFPLSLPESDVPSSTCASSKLDVSIYHRNAAMNCAMSGNFSECSRTASNWASEIINPHIKCALSIVVVLMANERYASEFMMLGLHQFEAHAAAAATMTVGSVAPTLLWTFFLYSILSVWLPAHTHTHHANGVTWIIMWKYMADTLNSVGVANELIFKCKCTCFGHCSTQSHSAHTARTTAPFQGVQYCVHVPCVEDGAGVRADDLGLVRCRPLFAGDRNWLCAGNDGQIKSFRLAQVMRSHRIVIDFLFCILPV